MLGPHQAAQRLSGAYTSDGGMQIMPIDDGFSLREQDAVDLASRLRVNMSIIHFNADRLAGHSYYLLALHESYRRDVLGKKDVALKEPTLNSKRMAVALEFYLQMDGLYVRRTILV